MPSHESIADIPEASLVRQLPAAPIRRGNPLNIYGFPDDAIDRQTVPLAGVSNGVTGDVDILVCKRGCPELAVAIEVKRIKVRNGRNVEAVEKAQKAKATQIIAPLLTWKGRSIIPHSSPGI